MGIFADGQITRERVEGEEYTFAEPKFAHLLKVRDIVETNDSVQVNEEGDTAEITLDDIHFDQVNPLIADLLVDWPSDREISEESIGDLKLDIYRWLMQTTMELIMDQGTVTEDEEKN